VTSTTFTAVSSSSVPRILTTIIPKFVQSHVDIEGPLPSSFEHGSLTDQQRENRIKDLMNGITRNIKILSHHYLIESVWFGQTRIPSDLENLQLMYTSDIMEQVLKQLGGIAQFQADIMACLMGGKNAIVPNKGMSILI